MAKVMVINGFIEVNSIPVAKILPGFYEADVREAIEGIPYHRPPPREKPGRTGGTRRKKKK